MSIIQSKRSWKSSTTLNRKRLSTSRCHCRPNSAITPTITTMGTIMTVISRTLIESLRTAAELLSRRYSRWKSGAEHGPAGNWLSKLPRHSWDGFHLQRSTLQRFLRRSRDKLPGVALLRFERRQSKFLVSQRHDFLTSCSDMRLVINL